MLYGKKGSLIPIKKKEGNRMKRILVFFFTLFVFTSLASPAEIKLDVKEHVLSNGLKILMIQKPGVPRVVCHIYFKVGSINEKPGITGLAHLHEHMMFKGTKMMGVTDFAKDDALNKQIDEVIAPALEKGEWVVCDRYCDATLAYQGYGRGLDLEKIQELNHIATGGLKPDMTSP